MTCTAPGCKRITQLNAAGAIKFGWRVYFSHRDGLGDKSMRDGDALCPRHAGPTDSESTRPEKPGAP